jgi:hypothetical protein
MTPSLIEHQSNPADLADATPTHFVPLIVRRWPGRCAADPSVGYMPVYRSLEALRRMHGDVPYKAMVVETERS